MTTVESRPIGATPTADTERTHQLARGLLALSRPGQWPKNALVASAPLGAGVLDHRSALLPTALMTLAFTAASIATYAGNDLADVDADRLHPTKRSRPLAAGMVSPRQATAWGLGWTVAALVLARGVGWVAVGIVGLYVLLNVAYSRGLKTVAVVEIAVVASGFVLRAISGSVATGITISSWFLLVALFGSLYLVTAKRSAEALRIVPAGPPRTRRVLDVYPARWLEQMMTISLAGTVLSYASWALQSVGSDVFTPVLALSVLPFLLTLMRYSLLVSNGAGETPEALIGRDRPLVAMGVCWIGLCVIGLYAA